MLKKSYFNHSFAVNTKITPKVMHNIVLKIQFLFHIFDDISIVCWYFLEKQNVTFSHNLRPFNCLTPAWNSGLYTCTVEDWMYIFMDTGENDDTWWYRASSFYMAMQGVTPLLSRAPFAAGNGRFWNSHRTHPKWVHAITISSKKWKTHSEGPGTTQYMNLSVL